MSCLIQGLISFWQRLLSQSDDVRFFELSEKVEQVQQFQEEAWETYEERTSAMHARQGGPLKCHEGVESGTSNTEV